MSKNVTFGHILTILAIIIIPLFLWGINAEIRIGRNEDNTSINKTEIAEIKSEYKKIIELISEKHDKTMEGLHKIELQVKDKQDRE